MRPLKTQPQSNTTGKPRWSDCRRVLPGANEWPVRLADPTYSFLDVVGDAKLLSKSLTAIFSSSRCTGAAIMRSTKWIGDLAENPSQIVIGGFHSAMEKEFLAILIEGNCGICICPARSLERYRVPVSYRAAIESGRLSILSSLPASIRSNSASSSLQRNRLVADLAEHIVITHASEGSRTEQFALWLRQCGKQVHCLDNECKRLLDSCATVAGSNFTSREEPRDLLEP